MERLAIAGAVLVCLAAGAAAEAPKENTVMKTFQTNNGMVGVASVAGITNRNGRVSSVSGVKFYPTPGAQDMGFYFPNVKSGEKLPEPISFSKEENGRITSGTIKIGPGSVSVSSSARSAYPASSASAKFGKQEAFNKPLINDMFFPYPLPFNSRSYDPWFQNNFAFRQPPQPKFDTLRAGWPYPAFSPFSYWQ